MSNVIPFRDPAWPLKGAERKAAIKGYRDGMEIVVDQTIRTALRASFRIPGVRQLAFEDALPVFVQEFQRHLRRLGW